MSLLNCIYCIYFCSGATDVTDFTASFSNFGSCVEMYAPGVNVLSTVPGGTDVYSGTSMACPTVAGAVARYMSSLDEAPTPAEVNQHLVNVMFNSVYKHLCL